MSDTFCAMLPWRPEMPSDGCAIISRRFGHRALFSVTFREAKRGTAMMAADRFTFSRSAALLLFALIAIPGVARSATLEDSAKELARKIAAALPAGENVSCEIRNLSSLKPAEASRIEQFLKSGLQEQGFPLAANGAANTVLVTLSENLKNFVWTSEIHQGTATQVILMAVERWPESGASLSALPVTIHSEKFWEGPQRILDAGEVSNGTGKSWLVLLLADKLLIKDQQTGSAMILDITSNQSAIRDPWGNLHFGLIGNTVTFFLAPRSCTVNLEAPTLTGCSPGDESAGAPPKGDMPVIFDIAPAGPPRPGKGTEVEMKSVCGTADQFLATGPRDYTQTDSLQVFQQESSGPVAVSAELDFPGPITAVHGASDPPRAVVRSLSTGNYEAYRLSFSCAQ